jgi:hypothetical protein
MLTRDYINAYDFYRSSLPTNVLRNFFMAPSGKYEYHCGTRTASSNRVASSRFVDTSRTANKTERNYELCLVDAGI